MINLGSYGTLTVERTNFDAATRTRVTGTVTDTVTLIISDVATSYTEEVVGEVNVDHWTHRTGVEMTSTVTAFVPGTIQGTDTGPVPAAGAAQTLRIGAHVYPVMFGTLAQRPQWQTELAAMPPNIDWVRMGLAWQMLQPVGPTWDSTAVAYIDGVMAHLAAQNKGVFLTVGGTPSWAGPSATGPATDPADFGQWVADVADRWGGVVEIIGIDPWNEWNTGVLSVEQVVPMMQAAHAALDGSAPLSIGALAFADVFSLAGLFDAGLTSSDFEMINFHPYPIDFFGVSQTPGWVPPTYAPLPESRWASVVVGTHQIEAVLADRGITGKELWLTEWGAPSNPTARSSPQVRLDDKTAAHWHTVILNQAKYITALKGVSIHEAADLTGAVVGSGWNAAWGLVHANSAIRRPKWTAVANIG